MIDLDDTYRRLARSWTHEQLADGYQEAARRGAGAAATRQGDDFARPITLLATAIPPAATVNVAIYVIHASRDGGRGALSEELITTAEKNAAVALHRCHHALELDGEDHGYTTEEWLPTVYDMAMPLLESARRDAKPPTAVRQAQEAISWLSRAIVELDQRSVEATASIAESLARLLTVWLFADQACHHGERHA